MDAIEFIKTIDRICKEYERCENCPIDNFEICGNNTDAKEFVSVVEKWAEAHPTKTRQSEFLKLFPNARLAPDGLIKACVKDMDGNHPCDWNCIKCRNDYWLKEIE